MRFYSAISPVRLCKYTFPIICSLFQTILSMPSFWKWAFITPIFKSGCAIDVENYRPISILPELSLVLERSIFNYLYPYLKAKISNSQHGFLKNRSTVTQLVEFVYLIYTCKDQIIATWTIYFEFWKAYDSVPNNLLLNRLSIMGLDQKFIDLLSSYLRGRSQRVRVDYVLSEFLEITSGVPQGSVLGPSYFWFSSMTFQMPLPLPFAS